MHQLLDHNLGLTTYKSLIDIIKIDFKKKRNLHNSMDTHTQSKRIILKRETYVVA